MRIAIAALTLALLALTPAKADTQGIADLEALRDGSMKKLVFHASPQPVGDVSFSDLDGGEHDLTAFRGQVVVLNFWATWCAPCREEMPALDQLQADLGGNAFQVVAIATGRNSPAGMRRFFEETEIENLELYTDPKQAMAREMAVLGLPVTVVLDADGHEIARLRGEADWNSESAKAIIEALLLTGS